MQVILTEQEYSELKNASFKRLNDFVAELRIALAQQVEVLYKQSGWPGEPGDISADCLANFSPLARDLVQEPYNASRLWLNQVKLTNVLNALVKKHTV